MIFLEISETNNLIRKAQTQREIFLSDARKVAAEKLG